MIGYCVRCRAKQEMLSATRTLMKNGRRAMLGICACCGTKMSVMGHWDDEAEAAATRANEKKTDEKGGIMAAKNG